MAGNEEINETIFAVHNTFAATEYGEKLSQSIRYEKYNIAHLTNEEWVRLLGADVNNLTHMPLTYGITQDFIRETARQQPDRLSSMDKSLLGVAAMIHDQGEAIVGDISYGDKTEADEAEEKLQLESNLDVFCPNISKPMRETIVQARDEIVFDSSSRLGRMFNAIERVGYVRTALRAAHHVQAQTAGEAETGLRWIVADVFNNQLIKLLEYATDYPAVNSYLFHQQAKISAAVSMVTTEDFANYGIDQHARETQFHTAVAAWDSWLQRLTSLAVA